MRIHHKTVAWMKEAVELVRGPIINEIYKEPPEHYLGYVLDGKVPVVMIPGVLNKWGYMKKLGDEISLLGHPVHIVPELGHNIEAIPFSASLLHKLVLSIVPKAHNRIHHRAKIVSEYMKQKDIQGVVLVAHSKGGLIGKYLLAHHNSDNRVLGLVAIATPFSGSLLARLMPHKAFRELQLDSKIIHDLKQHTNVNKKIISIYPFYDTHVWAPKGSYLEGAENIEVSIAGHSILGSKKVHEVVIGAVEKITRWANKVV